MPCAPTCVERCNANTFQRLIIHKCCAVPFHYLGDCICWIKYQFVIIPSFRKSKEEKDKRHRWNYTVLSDGFVNRQNYPPWFIHGMLAYQLLFAPAHPCQMKFWSGDRGDKIKQNKVNIKVKYQVEYGKVNGMKELFDKHRSGAEFPCQPKSFKLQSRTGLSEWHLHR